MEKTIDFLKEYRLKLKSEQKEQKFIRLISIVALSLYISLVLVLLAFKFHLNNKQEKLDRQTESVIGNIEAFQPLETKQIYLADKIKSLEDIFAKSKKHQQIFNSFFTLLPADLSVNNLLINEEGRLEADLTSDSFASLKNFVDNLYLNKENAQFLIKLAGVNSFTYKLERGYALTMEIGFFER